MNWGKRVTLSKWAPGLQGGKLGLRKGKKVTRMKMKMTREFGKEDGQRKKRSDDVRDVQSFMP